MLYLCWKKYFAKIFVNTLPFLCVCSARLAAAAVAGDHAGSKEEGKRDVITGGRPSHTNTIHISFESNRLILLLFDFEKNLHFSSQIVGTQREMQNPKNTKGTLPRRRKRRGRKMKSRKRNPLLAPHLKAAQLQVLSLKVKEVKGWVMANTLQLQHLTCKNRCPNWFQKANEWRRKGFPSSRRNLNCLE